ncbi:hypothetical protein AB0N05_23645 [Nocardia sp. NPDC051030]|uniref:hypothetical protein n=1 Tax=Nocardia sp. NPDC051030 TaxID=3155162 RepID=UPI0034195DA0
MPRDLPFDDESDTGEDADTAYRIANGVARVSRAGAYVTGGALIAASGARAGNSPAIDNDSRNVGWSPVNDPKPDVPSPTLTFPDLTPNSVGQPSHGTPGISPVNSPQSQFGDHHGTDAGLPPGFFGNQQATADPALTGFHGMGLPDNDANAFGLSGYQPGMNGVPSLENAQAQNAFGLPHVGADTTPGLTNPLDAAQPNYWQNLTGMKLPGTDGLHVPGMSQPANGIGGDHNPFDGIGEHGIGVVVDTNWNVDMHAGLDGVWFHSNMKVDVSVGDVYDQYVDFGHRATQGLSNPAGYQGQPAVDQHAPNAGAAVPASPGQPVGAATVPTAPGQAPVGANGPATPGSTVGGPNSTISGAGAPGSAVPGVGAPAAAVPGAGTPGASLPGAAAPSFSAPVAPAAPVAVNPIAPVSVAPPAPMPIVVAAPVVPVAVAPVAVAPVAVAQPVVQTPLQTTIQPDAATHPIANLLAMPAGPSPLTAPVANAPTLFDLNKQPAVIASGQPGSPDHPATLAAKPLPVTDAPGKTAPTVSVPTHTDPGLTTAPTVPTIKVPPATDPASTKIPVTTAPATLAPVTTGPQITTDPDAGTTRPTHPSDDDATHTRPTITVPTDDDTDTHGGRPTITVPTDSDSVPTTHQPTVSNPAHSDPTVPTVAPTVDVPTTHAQPTLNPPTTQAPIPTQAPLTNAPTVDVKPVKPVSAQLDSDHHVMPVAAITDDSGLYPTLHDGGLSTNLMHDGGFADSHYAAHGGLDHTMLL